MNREILIITQVACGAYILIVGLVICGLLIASVKTWLEIAFNAGRRCVRKITATRRNK